VKGNGGKCVDTDGCAKAPCGTNRECYDKRAPQTGFTCGPCANGFKESGKNCVDIDDCTTGGNPCGKGSSKCTNSNGPAWACTCKAGYAAVGQQGQQSCFVSNACAAKENDCVAGAKCNHVNHMGYALQFKDSLQKNYYSRNTGRYTMRNIALGKSKTVRFTVKAGNDAHLGFFSDKKGDHEVYEIVLSGWGNKKSVIREKAGGANKVSIDTKNLLNRRQYRPFWAQALNGLIIVGKGNVVGKQELMRWQDPKPHEAKYIGLKSGWGSDGRWRIKGVNRGEYELRVNTRGAKAGTYTLSAQVKYDTLFNGNMMMLHTRWYSGRKVIGTTAKGTPGDAARKRNGWVKVTTTFKATKNPTRLAWYIGYPQGQDQGNSWVTGLSLMGPDGKEYIKNGNFDRGRNVGGYCRGCSYGNRKIVKTNSPVGPALHTCQCAKGFNGDGYKAGTGCTKSDGCKGIKCATLVRGGAGKAPKCVMDAAGNGACQKCPPGYQPQPKGPKWALKCQDADDCSGGKAFAGFGALKCKEGKPGSGSYTITCMTNFKLKVTGGRAQCALDLNWDIFGKGSTCSASSTEAKFLAALKVQCLAAKLTGC